MRNFSKNPNKLDESEDDSDIDISVDLEEAVLPNPYSDQDASDINDDTSEADASSDADYEEETDSDSSSEQPVRESVNQPGTSQSSASTLRNNDAITHDEDEDDEDDATIKAIRSAINKKRDSPPEIKIDDFIMDISFHPDEDIIALATITGDVLLYKYANEGNSLLKKLEVHTKACRSIEFDQDGKCILSGSKDKSIMITDVETEKLKQFYDDAHDAAIYKLHIIDENMFATGDDSGTVKLWDKRSEKFIFAVKEVEDYISAMLTNEAKKLLLFTSGDGYLTTINIGSRKLFVQSEPYEEELRCMGLFRENSKVIVGTSKGRLYSYKWGEFGYHSDMFPGVKTPIECMLPITDRICCLGGEEGVLRATHIAPFKILGVVGQHSFPIEAMDINHSGEFIASSSHKNDVLFWNVKYFEDFTDIKYNVKKNDYKDRQYNLPSSKYSNNASFFSDLA